MSELEKRLAGIKCLDGQTALAIIQSMPDDDIRNSLSLWTSQAAAHPDGKRPDIIAFGYCDDDEVEPVLSQVSGTEG